MTSTDWLIALPVWGDKFRSLFARHVWPALSSALTGASGHVRFIVHTDDPAFAEIFRPYEVEVRKQPQNNHNSFNDAHRDAMRSAIDGEAVAFLNADIIVSRECFAAAERQFAMGKRAVVMAASRTVGPLFNDAAPKAPKARELLEWSLERLHPICQQCVYPHGLSAVPWAVYFSDGENVILRGFHLHPFAIMKSGDIAYNGSVDGDLLCNFRRSEIHVVTDPDEMALAEISSMGRRLPLRLGAMEPAAVADWADFHTLSVHRWFFEHRIVLRGSDRTEADAPAAEVLRMLEG